jgi:hypothetical protein
MIMNPIRPNFSHHLSACYRFAGYHHAGRFVGVRPAAQMDSSHPFELEKFSHENKKIS